MFRTLAGAATILFGGYYMVGGFGGYSRVVDRPPAEVAAALDDLDIADQPGSPGSQVASTRPSQAAKAAKIIHRASRSSPVRRCCRAEGPLRTFLDDRDERGDVAGILAMDSL